MPYYLPPRCPACLTPLTTVYETSHSTHSFNPTTGCYRDVPGDGDVDYQCPTCFADVYDALRDAVGNYHSEELAPCPPTPATS